MKYGLLSALCFILLAGCSGKSRVNALPGNDKPADSLQTALMGANKLISAKERSAIDAYCRRKQWELTETGTGLRYGIYEAGGGIGIETGDYVDLDYSLELLDGTFISDSKKNGSETVLIGEDNVESGLHEALTYLHKGDRAKVIIPSHLAYGLSGDQNKIPPFSTLVYDLHILDVSVPEEEAATQK